MLGRISLNSFRKVTAFLTDNCRFITSLTLSCTCLGDESVRFIVKAEWRYIAAFGFAGNNITSRGVKQLKECEWNFIQEVNVGYNPLKNAGVK